MEFTVIADKLRFPEGPVVMPDGSVIVVEIAAGQITRIHPDGRKEIVAKPGGGPNGAAIGPDGALYVCNNGGAEWVEHEGLLLPGDQPADYCGGRIERIDLATGAVACLYHTVAGRILSAPNDLVFDTNGGFWFTDTGKARTHDRDNGGVYYARADGSFIVQAIPSLYGGPNGIGLSRDGLTLYVSLTLERIVLSFRIVGDGMVAPSPIAALPGDVVCSFPGRMMVDSMAIDANGHICLATMVDRSGIATIDPDTGVYVHIETPDFITTNIAFGGPDMRDAYITLGSSGRLIKTRWPVPGQLLAY
jgi:gluconolactonase